jgi:hypothetical protein
MQRFKYAMFRDLLYLRLLIKIAQISQSMAAKNSQFSFEGRAPNYAKEPTICVFNSCDLVARRP